MLQQQIEVFQLLKDFVEIHRNKNVSVVLHQHWLQAPCEAEAQCAALVKAGKVYAVGTEDMDALTFGSTVLLRHLTFSEAR